MPELKINPQYPAPGSTVNVQGIGFSNQRTRLLLDGVGATINVFRPDKNGWFQVGVVVGKTAKVQILEAQQLSGSTWYRVAQINVPVTAAAPADWREVTGWRNVFADDFADRTVPKGQFTAGGTTVGYYLLPDGSISLTNTGGGIRKTAGVRTSDGRYLAFGSTPGGADNWGDTSKQGTYADSTIISIHDGVMDMEIYADANGYGHTCVVTPLPAGGSFRGGLVSGRSLVRFRADGVYGFKAVPLWWSDTAFNNNMLIDGEIDGPEGNLDEVPPKWYMHYTNATQAEVDAGKHQAYGSYPSGTALKDYHDFITEWRAGQGVIYYLDGTKVGEVYQRIPTKAMHFNLQFETSTTGQKPAPNSRGHILIERVGLWVPA